MLVVINATNELHWHQSNDSRAEHGLVLVTLDASSRERGYPALASQWPRSEFRTCQRLQPASRSDPLGEFIGNGCGAVVCVIMVPAWTSFVLANPWMARRSLLAAGDKSPRNPGNRVPGQ